MIDFIQGTLWNFAVWVFIGGVMLRILEIFLRGIKRDLAVSRGSVSYGSLGTIFRRFLPRKAVTKSRLFVVITGYMFHLGLFALLLFGAPHISFLEEHLFGFSWTSMPYWGFVLSAEIAFAGLILLWLRRIMHPVTRLLSTFDDYLAAGLTFFAMLTGCLALFESYAVLRILHLFSVELLMIYFPFSNLMHAFTFVASRSFTGAAAARHGVKA